MNLVANEPHLLTVEAVYKVTTMQVNETFNLVKKTMVDYSSDGNYTAEIDELLAEADTEAQARHKAAVRTDVTFDIVPLADMTFDWCMKNLSMRAFCAVLNQQLDL